MAGGAPTQVCPKRMNRACQLGLFAPATSRQSTPETLVFLAHGKMTEAKSKRGTTRTLFAKPESIARFQWTTHYVLPGVPALAVLRTALSIRKCNS